MSKKKSIKVLFLAMAWSFIFPAHIFAMAKKSKREVASLGIEDQLLEHFEENSDVLEKLNLIFETVPARGSNEEAEVLTIQEYLDRNPNKVAIKFSDDFKNGDIEIRLNHPRLNGDDIFFTISAYHIEKDKLLSQQRFTINLKGNAKDQMNDFNRFQKLLVDRVSYKLKKGKAVSAKVDAKEPIVNAQLNFLVKSAKLVGMVLLGGYLLGKVVGSVIPEKVKKGSKALAKDTKLVQGSTKLYNTVKRPLIGFLGKNKKVLIIVFSALIVGYGTYLTVQAKKLKRLKDESLDRY